MAQTWKEKRSSDFFGHFFISLQNSAETCPKHDKTDILLILSRKLSKMLFFFRDFEGATAFFSQKSFFAFKRISLDVKRASLEVDGVSLEVKKGFFTVRRISLELERVLFHVKAKL